MTYSPVGGHHEGLEDARCWMVLSSIWPQQPQAPCEGYEPWHFLYFFPLPHGQGAFRPTPE